MVDAAAADQARVSLAARIGEAAAEGLIPHQPREEQALQRAELLMGTVSGRAHGMLPGVRLQGTGPFGMATPADVQDTVDQLRAAALKVWPRLEQLMRQPGAQQLVADLNALLARRFAARSIKFVFGAQQQIGSLLGGGDRGGDSRAPLGPSTSPVAVRRGE
mmetsp:Transcript_18999/g.56597  ORF Transcript_18999/g.56597 Transcript_18999/m.56597 type:complete len:162 (-) Transcript_18999:296-781(-)